MPGASLALFADLGACHVQKSSVTICVLPAPSGWRATGLRRRCKPCHLISIHALRVEGDGNAEDKRVAQLLISIHALRVEGDLDTYAEASTGKPISIHALRVEGDTGRYIFMDCAIRFLSTPSGWRATRVRKPAVAHISISIHALRVEGDRTDRPQAPRKAEFLSTPSGWRATAIARTTGFAARFLSTPSGGRATFEVSDAGKHRRIISIHALRVEGDLFLDCRSGSTGNFYPRPPGGGRHL